MRTVIQFLKNLKIFKKQKMTPFNILNHIFTWTLLGLLYISCVKQPNGSRNETDFVASVQNHWTDLRKNHFLSGSIIIKKNAQILFSDGDLDEKFLIGSVSKSFVGYFFFTNQDKILLDTKVCVYIKTFCAGSFAKVSVGSLLQHRSGFTRYFEATNNIKNAFSDFKLADLDKLALDEDDFDVEKYTKLSYSNMGYNYLSRIIEIIEQKQFYEVIAAIATEAHLKSTYLSMPNDKIKVGLAIPYISSSIKIPIINQAKIAYGSGGIVSTANDLITWADFLKSRGLYSEFNIPVTEKYQYNFGIVYSPNYFSPMYWHNGQIIGYRSEMLSTSENLRVIILTNHFKPFKFFEDQFEVFESLFKQQSKKEKI